MELTVHSPAASSLRGTRWRLRSFTAQGVRASLSSDMLIELAFGLDGTVHVDAGLLTGAGAVRLGDDVVSFGGLALSGVDATVPGALEDRVVRACLGPFLVQRGEGVLLLRQDGTQLELVAA